ncbi:zinc ribbon domain-containing protein [Oleiagrimonas sp.]|jgi:putative FmdB family regulatory protein|uniref:FmdB family zinc ribbon protein n=1 Tax=Oleiagrimonas sp. TaxID=2010330 RepID=UPI00260AA9B9|nr:zinc ribbon domain-containing protein [Oleiagrimonas sp.]MDA3913674.1 zinc ribbon domain-containing protein [Oleiagrimonas sp.]
MPIYEYIATTESGCEQCRSGMQLLRRLSDPELTVCPHCGAPVTQRISAPNVVAGNSHRTSEGHLEKHGFTQYRKTGTGVYEKTAGKGPAHIADDGK